MRSFDPYAHRRGPGLLGRIQIGQLSEPAFVGRLFVIMLHIMYVRIYKYTRIYVYTVPLSLSIHIYIFMEDIQA